MNLHNIVKTFNILSNHGTKEVSNEDFKKSQETAKNVFVLIERFVDKHGNIALSCGGEWMYQDDKGQVDALELVSNILESLSEFAEDSNE